MLPPFSWLHETATRSMTASMMIAISIMRISPFIAHRPRVQSALGAIHIVLIPILAILMASFVLHASIPV